MEAFLVKTKQKNCFTVQTGCTVYPLFKNCLKFKNLKIQTL